MYDLNHRNMGLQQGTCFGDSGSGLVALMVVAEEAHLHLDSYVKPACHATAKTMTVWGQFL